MVMELHASTREDLRPDPDFDPIEAVFYSIINNVPPDTEKTEETGTVMSLLFAVLNVCHALSSLRGFIDFRLCQNSKTFKKSCFVRFFWWRMAIISTSKNSILIVQFFKFQPAPPSNPSNL